MHKVTPGTEPLEPLFSVTTHNPPGPTQSESAAQYLMHVEIAAVVLVHQLPAAQSLPVHCPPIGTLPAATHSRMPVSDASSVHTSPAAQPHCGATSLHGDSLHEPPALELEDEALELDDDDDDDAEELDDDDDDAALEFEEDDAVLDDISPPAPLAQVGAPPSPPSPKMGSSMPTICTHAPSTKTAPRPVTLRRSATLPTSSVVAFLSVRPAMACLLARDPFAYGTVHEDLRVAQQPS
ncbi:MAG: hypothetical protein IPM54_41095 [Polyangiaceae bacterium]|nr:hypothetical protein [Polyangiaceae bacterium]